MNEEIILNFGLGFCLLLVGLMFLYGYFHNNYKRRFSLVIDLDQVFFKDKNELIRESDKLAFWVCISMSFLTVGNGILMLLVEHFPNISMIFICVGFLGSWLMKYVFLIYYKNCPDHLIPKIWSFKAIKSTIGGKQ